MAVYRNDATLARIGSMLRMLAIVGLAIGAIGMVRAISEGGHLLTAAASSGLLAVGVAAVILGRRARAAAIETSAEGIEVRNLFSTRRFAWADVRGFEEGSRRRGMTLAVVRTSEEKVHALSAAGDPGTVSAKILDKLRKELTASRR